MKIPYSQHARLYAKALFFRGYSVNEIAEQLGIVRGTVGAWATRENWEGHTTVQRIAKSAELRLCVLIAKTQKSDADYKEIQELGLLMERTARMEKYSQTKNEADLNPNVRCGQQKRKKSMPKKNFLDAEQVARCHDHFLAQLYPHQKKWYEHGKKYQTRNYLKSRQIGATYYFAMEAALKAIKDGKNQIFLSASKAQAHVFKRNIINFVRDATDVVLTGDPIIFGHNGAELHFLGTNKNTAQSYSGDLYIDEYFWIANFKDIEHVASGMTVLDDRSLTYFSTPSAINHQAYPLWTGDAYNAERPKADHIEIDTSHKALKEGALCADGVFRQIITINDAVESGYDLVSLDKLAQKFAPSKYANLFLCEFVNDLNSVFKLAELQKCMVDSWTKWHDFKPLTARPYGDKPVWLGYDPSRSCDDSSLAVVAPPATSGGKFRVLECISWQDMDFDRQARKIHELMRNYNVVHIAIDATGVGSGVYELVKKFFPTAQKIVYTVEVKNALVLKAKQLISHRRLEFDYKNFDIAHAFMTIHQDTTSTGRQVTYKAARTSATGHADLAWALMHALSKEPLQSINTTGTTKKTGFMETF